MRFRGKLVDVGCVANFTRVLNTIAKLTKTCTLHLSSDKLYFIVSDRAANGGVTIWCELVQNNFFDEYQMDGLSVEFNEIYLDIPPDSIARALKTAQSAKSVKIKLTKKHCPYLTLDVELASLLSHSRVVTHDIPVQVVPQQLWSDHKEPAVPDFDVSIYLPPFKTLKSVMDKMKNLTNFMVVQANQSGEMNLEIDTELVSVTTYFKDLGNPPWASVNWSQDRCHGRDPKAMAQAKVDTKKLLQFVAGQQINADKAVCNIVDKKLLHFILLHEDVTLQYFLPAVTM
uniref:checkpoint protein HUS1 n=1 Tax=Myxine glutinosa TaxID=7769 RepID=UPI00358F15F8